MREKLIELFYDNNVRCDQKIEGLAEDVMDIVANGVTVQEWISVKDRLPESGETVLCLLQGEGYWVSTWDYADDEMWSDGERWCSKDVATHWMPLPQPPKGE